MAERFYLRTTRRGFLTAAAAALARPRLLHGMRRTVRPRRRVRPAAQLAVRILEPGPLERVRLRIEDAIGSPAPVAIRLYADPQA